MNANAPHSTRLLLIAPASPMRDELAATIELQGHALDVADSLEAAEPNLGKRPALALIALGDERLDGLAAGRALRRLATELPLLALVPAADRQTRVRCLNAGFDDLVATPIDALELRVRMRGLLQAARAVALERALAIAEDRRFALGALTGSLGHDLCNHLVRMQYQLDELCESGVVPLAERLELRRTFSDVAATSRQFSKLSRFSRAEAAEPLQVADELRRIVKQLVAIGPLREVELALRAPEDAWLFAERAQLEQLVCNLVTSALEGVADLPRDARALSICVESRGAAIGLRVEGVRPAGSPRDPARPRSTPRPLGLGAQVVQALALSCGGRTSLEPSFSGRHVLTVVLPRCEEPRAAEDSACVA